MSRKSTAAQGITGLFDGGDWAGRTSTLRDRAHMTRTYDPKTSWAGLSQGKFSRTDIKGEVPLQRSGPVALEGATVLPLDDSKSLEMLNVRQEAKQLTTIPLTREQRDLSMSSDLKGRVPVHVAATHTNRVVIAGQLPGFRNLHPTPPVYEAIEVPTFMAEAGPQADQRLLNPTQRRQIMEFDKKLVTANLDIKHAKAVREKTRKQLASVQYNRGVLMVDSAENEESEIYGQLAHERRVAAEQKELIHLERRANLAQRTSSITTHGNIVVPDTVTDRVVTAPEYQRKGGDNHALTFEETYNRVFVRRLGNPIRAERTQNLRNNDLSGKSYNMINHTVIEHWPSQTIDRLEDKGLQHPSQAALHTTRLLQGTSTDRRNYY